MLPVVGLTTGSASAKPKPKATPQILVRASPNPVVETANSAVAVVIQVESNPSNAGTPVTISSTQLFAHCTTGTGTDPSPVFETYNSEITGPVTILLDNDGNASVLFEGANCAPGSALIDASLDGPPFSTAITKLVLTPPQVTPPGVKAFPNPEVEVGDQPLSFVSPPGDQFNVASEAQFVFYVETNPVYAEQSAHITSDQLTERCQGSEWEDAADDVRIGSVFPFPVSGIVAFSPIDNDGNAVFEFWGNSCAAGKSTVIAEILAGGPTYSTQVNILPPAVTI